MKNFQVKSIILGIGIGIVFTALVSIIYNAGGYSSMSREEIIEAAKSYGMIESESLIGYRKKTEATNDLPKKSDAKDNSSQNSNETQKTNAAEDTKKEQTGAEAIAGQTNQDKLQEQTIKPEEQVELVNIYIQEGDTSYTVGEKLANAGLVPSAGEFNIEIINSGLQSNIRAGSYQIKKGASIQEIINEIVPVMQ